MSCESKSSTTTRSADETCDDGRRSLNVVLVGEEAAGIQALRMLAGTRHRVIAVFASPSKETKAATLWNTANHLGFTTWPAELVKTSSLPCELRSQRIDVLLNVHSLFIIDAGILDRCEIGAFNVHPGPLPHYAGLNVPSWAIYFGETEHAVTVHWIVPRIDAGQVAFEARFPITPQDTGFSLMSKCVRSTTPMLRELLDLAAQGPDSIPRIQQDLSQRRYFGRKAPDRGRMSWNRPAQCVIDHVRASDYSPFRSPWGHPLTEIGLTTFGIVKAVRTNELVDLEPGTVGAQTDSGTYISTADEWVLVSKIQFDGRVSSPNELLQPGDRLAEYVPDASQHRAKSG